MSKSWSLRADLFRTSFSLVGCDLLQSRGRARRFLSWQEQPSPNSKNDIRGLRLEKRMLGAGSVRLRAFGRLAGLANPLGDYGQGVRLLALTGARRSEVFWHDVADSDSVNLGSNPGPPAKQSGLRGIVSRCVRTRDIPAGYAGGSQSLAGNFRYFGPLRGRFRAPVSARHFLISV